MKKEIAVSEVLLMKTRVITAIVALPVFIIPILFGGPLLYGVFLLASILGLFEFNRAFSIKNKQVFVIEVFVTLIHTFIVWNALEAYYFSSVALLFMLLFIYYVLAYPRLELRDLFYSLIGFYYLPLMLSHIVLLRQIDTYGSFMVWLIFIISFGSDTFAYAAGRTLGKHKLSKELSPKKTIEGSIGGILGAAVLTVLYALYGSFTGYEFEVIHYVGFAFMGAFGSIISQFGDISASAMKRVVGIKDFGKIMPGHGGLIDRIDSLIFVSPFVYYALLFILKGF